MEISLDILDTLDICYIPPLKQTLKVTKKWMPFPGPGASAARRMASRGSRWSRATRARHSAEAPREAETKMHQGDITL